MPRRPAGWGIEMCGIVGTFGSPGISLEWVRGAADRLAHRGPDASATWLDSEGAIGLGHRRLAIQDLSQAGAQPMSSACGRYHIVFNGEIYNHLSLRAALSPRMWRGHSDTETLLECVVEWGVARTLQAMVGMFAFALFDRTERRLILARDRFGEKPLYFGYAGRAFVFASELKGLRDAPSFDATVDRDSLSQYVQRGFVPAPRSIYSSIRKLQPGTWLELTRARVAACELPEPNTYWSAQEVALAGAANPLEIGTDDAVQQLDAVLGTAIKGQMLSDVPLGAFLSGGIDSSTIVALMQKQSAAPVRTFSIGFEEAEFDESAAARQVADHLGTHHTELMARGDDMLPLVRNLPAIYDEPFADSSQLPTLLVSRLARSHVTVALSGDGGDELFAGYSRYHLAERGWSRLSRIPFGLRRALAASVRAVPVGGWNGILGMARVAKLAGAGMTGDRILKAADILLSRDSRELYLGLNQFWRRESPVLHGSPDRPPPMEWRRELSLTQRAMLHDVLTYLPDDILTKVDRASMAFSLETRVPFLDHRVYELAWRMPMGLKVRDGRGKQVLRELLYRYVPPALVERPKQGFAVPLAAWLRGPLREWASELLDPAKLRQEQYLDARLVTQRWQEHQSRSRSWHHELWTVLMFQAWLRSGV